MTDPLNARRVQRDDTPVMFTRADDDSVASIQRAWAEFEAAVGLPGRHFLAAYDARSREYRVCVVLRDDDDPTALGYELTTLPGGSYLRVRLRGEPPAVYDRILPLWDRLRAAAGAVDSARPSLEYYRSRDVIDLLLPVA